MRKLLEERLRAVQENPKLLTLGRWTQSTVYYTLRRKLIQNGIPVRSRKYITSSIKPECEALGIRLRNGKPFKRDELGIIAAERAQLYFNGQSIGVSIDEVSNLIKKGTDLVIIEKENIVQALAPFADRNGVALLNTRGFLTEYATELSNTTGSNVVILTDYDVSGLLLAAKIPGNIHRIGVDNETLDYFGIDKKVVEETYKDGTFSEGHYEALKELAKKNPDLKKRFDLSYLKNKRIEIDSVLADVDDNEHFWKYITDKLSDKFPYRDYNRAIEVAEHGIPELHKQFWEFLSNKISEIQAPIQKEIMNELRNVKGFLEVDTKLEEIEKRLNTLLDNPEELLKKFMSEFLES